MNNFEILQFPTTRGGGRSPLVGNTMALTRTFAENGSIKYNALTFSREIRQLLAQKALTHIQLHIDKYTGVVYMVCLRGDDSADARIVKHNTMNTLQCNNRNLVLYLLKKFGVDEKMTVRGYRFEVSPDLSNSDEFATFRIVL